MTDLTRPLLAAMVSDDLRRAFAEIIGTGQVLPEPQRARALTQLEKSGLLTRDGESYAFDPQRAVDTLRAMAAPQKQGVARFLTATGTIDRYPSDASERIELLTLIAKTVMTPGRTYDEMLLTELLATRATDAVLLRRHLVDYGIVDRTPSGSNYWLSGTIQH